MPSLFNRMFEQAARPQYLAQFGQSVTYRQFGSDGNATDTAITAKIEDGTARGDESSTARVTCSADALPSGHQRGDHVVIDSAVWVITGHEPGDHGLVILTCRKAARLS